MIKNIKMPCLLLFVITFFNSGISKEYTIKSPDSKITVTFRLTPEGTPVYSATHSGNIILNNSKLGVTRSDGNFSSGMSVDSVSSESTIKDNYTLLHGKRINCKYTGNRRIIYLKNQNSKIMEIIFQVSNDGIGFRYFFPGKTDSLYKILNESTSFKFETSAKAFLQPCPDARTGWCFSQPSYEEYYELNIPVGTSSPYQAGWVMPALFNSGKFWVSITETAIDTYYCASRLSQLSPGGEYTIQFAQPQEVKGSEPALPQSNLPWYSPWRVIAISEGLAGLIESTLETDLAIPAKYDVSSWLEPGISSWSWVILKDSATIYKTQKEFIDFAASMNWKYCLIDAMWDTQIGYEKIKELADYAKSKNVKILLWYNSAGDWNTTPLTPRDKMISSESRLKEFQTLKDIGIAGIKVDFFGGDGQSMMKYYIDILKDAAKFNIAVNFHGATFPRGWHRTYPNLVSMEAIKGEEYVTFSQFYADQQPVHCTVIPFTRNLFDPMDFTPVNFSGIPNINRKTTGGFEIALSVLFTSGIQHIAETPGGMAAQKDFVQEYMKTLPERWDDVKFIDGYPGKYVIMARRAGNTWYIAGINGENNERPVTLNMSFINNKSHGIAITDSESAKDGFTKSDIDFSKPVKINMQPHGGFVIKTLQK